jgi:hypothetical protein
MESFLLTMGDLAPTNGSSEAEGEGEGKDTDEEYWEKEAAAAPVPAIMSRMSPLTTLL